MDDDQGAGGRPWSLADLAGVVARDLVAAEPGPLAALARFRLAREFARGVIDDTAGSAQTRALVTQEPPSTGDPGWDALLGGLAEWVAARRGFDPPNWCLGPGRFLDHFVFPVDTPSARATGLARAPAVFRRRGVLLDPFALSSDGRLP